MKLKKLVLVSSMGLLAAMNTSLASAQFIDINGDFEDGLSGWDTSGNADTSGRTRNGDVSARLRGSGAEISRDVAVLRNTNYRFKGFINAEGRIGYELGNNTTRKTATNVGKFSWKGRTLNFNSGNNDTVTLFAQYRSATGRFDDFTLENRDGTGNGSGDFGLNPNAEPWENFDLSHWKLDTPASRSSSQRCRTQVTEPEDWQNGNVDDGEDGFEESSIPYFHTHTDGGMRFVSEVGGATTGGQCSSRTRSELRELVVGADNDSIGDSDYRNNWALASQPQNSASGEQQWGARGGKMTATLRVNQVTTTGSSAGRTVIGQIHAEGNEPLRLNYKHVEGTDRGCIYASSEERPEDGDEDDYVLIGSTGCGSEPSNGIELDELFSYEIENFNSEIRVIIYRGDAGSNDSSDWTEINRVSIPLGNAGYNVNNDYMYFKAGAYTQTDNANDGDGDIVTFYRLNVTH